MIDLSLSTVVTVPLFKMISFELILSLKRLKKINLGVLLCCPFPKLDFALKIEVILFLNSLLFGVSNMLVLFFQVRVLH